MSKLTVTSTKPTTHLSSEQMQWRPLDFLNLYRLLISGIFVALIFTQIQVKPFGISNPELFQIVSFGYLIASLLNGITIRWHWPALWFQSHIHIILDFCAILLVMYSSGGMKSGVGLLLLIPIAAISVLSMGRASLFYASLISLILLIDQAYLHITHGDASYAQAGLLGGFLFLTAFLTNYLVNKTEESVEIASRREVDLANMEQLTQFIMQRMQTGVIVVNYLGNVRLINDTAINQLKLPTEHHKQFSYQPINLYEYSLELGEMFQSWKNDPDIHSHHIDHAGSSLTPRFASLGNKKESGAVVFLEDNAEISHQAQQLKLASLGRLTASIAHELRNPLAAIRHAGELLHESPSLEKTDLRLTEIIEKQSLRVNEIIGTILNLSRSKKAEQESINLFSWIKEFLNDYIQLPRERFYLKFENEQLMITFDPLHLQQVFNNLIQNALRHTIEYHHHFRPIVITAGIDIIHKHAFLQVMNYGESIPDENIDQLFEPFFTTEATGTGLGLYIAREMASSNAAKLDYIDIKEGACFQLTFSDIRRKN
jgi:two-component system sensor histidine kinase PilS (NtrC family)